MDDPDDFEKIPKFGDSSSKFEEVVSFYAHWESYSTKKSYAWLFTHNISEIRDRRVLKLVDKEHKKIQQKARKERNEEIRSLVLFVKKRDKRMAEYRKMLEEKAQFNRLKSEKNRLEQIKARSEMIKEQQKNRVVKSEHEDELRQLEESYLNQYSDSGADDSEADNLEEDLDNVDLNESEQVFEDELYCVACNKFFNSESAKQNHEASKKHRQNMELLKSEMEAEEENYQQKANDVENAEVENGSENHDDDEHVSDEEEVEPVKKSKGKKSKKKNKKVVNYDNSESEAEEAVEEIVEPVPVTEEKIVESDDEDWSNSKKPKKVKSKGKSKIEKPKPAEPEVRKEEVQVKPPTVSESSEVEPPSEHNCATCKSTFPSKNKLFAHLKKTNHSIYLSDSKAKTGEKPSLKKKK